MTNAPVIARRELNGYFFSPVAYVLLTAFALMQGMWFARQLGTGVVYDLSSTAQQLFFWPFFALMFFAPIMTMRLLSEEARSGTLETLMTTPTGEPEVVVGKFAAALIFAVIMLLPVAAQVAFLGTLGPLDTGGLLAIALGLLLLTAQYVAVGLFCSAMTHSQTAAAISGIMTLLMLAGLDFLARIAPHPLARPLAYLSPDRHFRTFVKGIVDTRDLTYFLVTTAALLFLTTKALSLRRVPAPMRGRRAFGRAAFGRVAFTTYVVAALALAGLLCYVSTRGFMRADWTRRDVTGRAGLGRHELHEPTLELLGTLDRNVEATVLYHLTGQPENDRLVTIWRDTTLNTLDEFAARSRRITVRALDVGLHPEQLAPLKERVKPAALPDYGIIFESGDDRVVVRYEETIRRPTVGVFLYAGEAAFTEALKRLTTGERSVLYVATALNLEAPASDAGKESSISRAVATLSEAGYEIRRLPPEGEVPEDCAALLLAGFEQAPGPERMEALRRYLDGRDGRAVFMIDPGMPEPAVLELTPLLARYGIGIRPDAVAIAPKLDDYARLVGYVDRLNLVVPEGMAGHPIAADMARKPVPFRRACPLLPGHGGLEQMLEPQALLVSPFSSWGETDYIPGSSINAFDRDRDVAAPLMLAAVAEPPTQVDGTVLGGPKVVVFGSSRSFTDACAADNAACLRLLRNAVDWMAHEYDVGEIRPRILKTESLSVPARRLRMGRWGFIAGLPLLVVALGIAVWLARRR